MNASGNLGTLSGRRTLAILRWRMTKLPINSRPYYLLPLVVRGLLCMVSSSQV